MATSGKIDGTTKNSSGKVLSYYATWIEWKRNSYDSAGGTSNITIDIMVQRSDGQSIESAWNLNDKPSVSLKVGGSAKTPSAINYLDTRWLKLCKLATWTGNVTHNADGSITLPISCSWTVPNLTYLASGSISSSDIKLETIPRYATSVQSEKSKTETSITMNWSSDNTIDYIWYSTDWGTTWKAVGSVNAKSGSYTINTQSKDTSSLSANTTYNIITRVRRKDSQLTTNSAKLSVTTHNYPYCTKAPDFIIGNPVTLEFYNPLSRQISWQLLGVDGSLIAGNGTTGTSYTGINGDGSVANFYKSIPNAKSGTYTVKVAYGSIVNTKTGGTYSIKGTEIPTINSLTYIDNNSTTVAITGNNQHIVQNYSTLLANASATANNGAGGISKYVIECNGKTIQGASAGNFNIGTIDSANNVDLKLTVTDTRGLSASKTIKVSILAHSEPTALITLERLNNYEDETYLTVDGSISSVNSKNTMAIKYRYKVSGGSYGSYVTINDRQKYTLSLDKNNVYVFNVVITDAFGSTFNGEVTLNKGVFPLFIDTEKNSVGINCFPKNNNSLEVNDLDISTITKITKSLKLNANTWTDTGIYYDQLATGTYIMQVTLTSNTSTINNQFGERISGILTWYALPTNSNDADVIPVSKAGHTRNGHNIQLRVLRTPNTSTGVLKLQILDDVAWNGSEDVVFRFKRLI